MRFAAIFVLLLVGVSANPFEEVKGVLSDYVTELAEKSPLDFQLVVQGANFYDDGSVKYTDVLAFSSNQNKTPQFKLSSLGKKQIDKLVTKAEDEGVTLAVLHENYVKNTSKNYDTEIVQNSSPAGKIVSNKDGFVDGVLEELLDTLYETSGVAKIDAVELYPHRKLKRKISLTIQSKKVVVKESRKMNAKMIDEGKKLLKSSFKVDADDRSKIIAHVFEKRYPDYSWEIYINPVAYTSKSDVMAKFKYDDKNYVVLGHKK